MKILVTGGAGYLGSVLLPLLLRQGHSVVLLDTFSWGLKPVLHFATDPGCTLVTGDIRDRSCLEESCRGVDLAVHLAAIVGYPACAAHPERARSTNIEGTANLVELLGERPVIFASTGSTYGKVEGVCTEQTPIDPLTLYGMTKREAEKHVLGKGGVALRFATLFGVSPRLRLDLLINDFVYQALHARQIVLYEGHFRRTFLHVLDAASVFLLAIERCSELAGQIFNVGDEALNLTKRDIALKIRERLPFYLHEADVGSDPDQRDYEVCYDKVRGLGFKRGVSIEAGVDELIKVLRHLRVSNSWRNV